MLQACSLVLPTTLGFAEKVGSKVLSLRQPIECQTGDMVTGRTYGMADNLVQGVLGLAGFSAQPGLSAKNLQPFYLQRVGRAHGRRFVFVSELLLRLTPEFVLSAFGPAVPLPNLVGAALDFHVGRLGYHVTFQIPGRVVASSPSRAAGGSAC